jgi:hypothetical protein
MVVCATQGLWRSAFGWLEVGAGTALLAGVCVRVWSPATRAATIAATIAGTAQLALPKDWMGEFRFATAFVPFGLLVAAGLVADARFGVLARNPVLAGVLAAALLLPNYVQRAVRFQAAPTISMQGLAAEHVATFERYRALVGGPRSLLTEDVGAPLLFGTLRIHDLAGLCDPVIAQLLYRNPKGLADHVFGTLRPDFIRLASWCGRRCGLQDDPRFRGDYVAIRESPPLEPGEPPLGHYVRRHLVADARLLAELRALR